MNNIKWTQRVAIALAVLVGAFALIGWVLSRPAWWQPGLVTALLLLAAGTPSLSKWREYTFTVWIVAIVTLAMLYPARLLHFGPVDLTNKRLLLTLLQLIMFGMGTQMKIADFAGVLKMPWGVLVGVAGQFTVMPLVGYALTRIFSFDAEVSAGIVLIGCCSSGLASNVMTYMARANLALSITMTSITTVLAPFVTPLWMKLLAGQLVDVRVLSMMFEITKLVLVPVIAGLLHDFLVTTTRRGRQIGWAMVAFSAIGLVILALLSIRHGSSSEPVISPWLEVLAYLAGALVAGAAFHGMIQVLPQGQIAMPFLSMFGIIVVVGIITAAGRDEMVKVGGWLCLAAVLHNLLGYALGYWLARACRLDKSSARTIAFEVGMQNGGMASGIASSLGKLGTMGLAPAIFAAWMSVSGSLLANYWRKRP